MVVVVFVGYFHLCLVCSSLGLGPHCPEPILIISAAVCFKEGSSCLKLPPIFGVQGLGVASPCLFGFCGCGAVFSIRLGWFQLVWFFVLPRSLTFCSSVLIFWSIVVLVFYLGFLHLWAFFFHKSVKSLFFVKKRKYLFWICAVESHIWKIWVDRNQRLIQDLPFVFVGLLCLSLFSFHSFSMKVRFLTKKRGKEIEDSIRTTPWGRRGLEDSSLQSLPMDFHTCILS